MFERFTKRARQAIVDAQVEASALGHNYIGTEHLLLGLLADSESMAAKLLAEFDVIRDGTRARVLAIVGPGALTDRDAEALSAIGIDLDAVRQAVESSFGPGALDPPLPPGCKRKSFTARAKKVLELSLRQAINLEHNYIGTEHILLGLLREADGVAGQILGEGGVTLDVVLKRLRPGA